jgi:hypothetical protein
MVERMEAQVQQVGVDMVVEGRCDNGQVEVWSVEGVYLGGETDVECGDYGDKHPRTKEGSIVKILFQQRRIHDVQATPTSTYFITFSSVGM